MLCWVVLMRISARIQRFEHDFHSQIHIYNPTKCAPRSIWCVFFSLYFIFCQGYVKRQALYACLTCVPESKTDASQRTGVCLACSYKCHDGHDLIELYTKRAFRCDCGTSKILAIRCKLDSNKLDDNDDNTYNQNFSGVYCICHRPYPDPEDTIDDEMIQCIVCEDWYHSR